MKPIGIHGAPRSGTTWLGEMFNAHLDVNYAYQPINVCRHGVKLDHHTGEVRIRDEMVRWFNTWHQDINRTADRAVGLLPQPLFKPAPYILTYKQTEYHNLLPNMMSEVDDLGLVLIVRSPLSVVASQMLAYRARFGQNAEFDWRGGSNSTGRTHIFEGFEGWKRAAALFKCLELSYPERVILIRYEELVDKPKEVATHLFEFHDIDMHARVLQFIDKSTSINMNEHHFSVYRKDVDTMNKWKDTLTDDVVTDIISECEAHNLSHYLGRIE